MGAGTACEAKETTAHPPRDKELLPDWRSSQVPIVFVTARCAPIAVIYLAFFLYIASMRWVTRKPPKIFTQAKISAMKPKPRAQPEPDEIMPTPTASSAPTTITEEIALVTDISGVCSAGVTDQTTK